MSEQRRLYNSWYAHPNTVHFKSNEETRNKWLNCALSWLDSSPSTHCTCNPSSKYFIFYNVVWIAAPTHPVRQHTNTSPFFFFFVYQALWQSLTSSPILLVILGHFHSSNFQQSAQQGPMLSCRFFVALHLSFQKLVQPRLLGVLLLYPPFTPTPLLMLIQIASLAPTTQLEYRCCRWLFVIEKWGSVHWHLVAR